MEKILIPRPFPHAPLMINNLTYYSELQIHTWLKNLEND